MNLHLKSQMFTHSKVDLIFGIFWDIYFRWCIVNFNQRMACTITTKELFERVANLLVDLRNKPYPTVFDCIQMSAYLLALRIDALEVS